MPAYIGKIEQKVLFPQFVLLQETEAKQDMQRIVSLIDHELTSVSQKVADWAAWDDTYEYVIDHNPDYEESNLLLESLIHMQINMLAIFDLEGQLIWGQGCNWRQEMPLSLDILAQGQLSPDHQLLQHQSPDDAINGILECPQGHMLFSAMPIVTSERTGPSRGTLMMGRFLDRECIDQWSQELSVPFSLEKWDEQAPPPHTFRDSSNNITGTNLPPIYSPWITSPLISNYPIWKKQNNLFIQAVIPATILSRGITAMRFSTFSIFIVGGLLLLTMYAGLHWTLLGRLRHFSQHFHDIAQKNDLSKRIRVSQADEMSHLQSSFNSMLHNLEQSDRALRASEETYRQIFNTVQDCLFVLNSKGVILAANPSARDLFDLNQAGQNTQEMTTLISPMSQSDFELFMEQTLNTGQSSQELSLICTSHQTLNVRALGRQTHMLEQTCILMILRDIEEHREIALTLQQAREDARKAQAAKSGLLRNVTHEMRSPLNDILGFCTLLGDDALDPTHEEYLSHIRSSSEELMAMVNSIIDISRIETGDLVLEMSQHPLDSLIHDIETIARTKAQNKGLECELICDKALPDTLVTDPQRLLQCLKVVIDNAVKFTPTGVIKIKIYSQPHDHPTQLCLAIIDQGPGLPTQAQGELLEAFTQADTRVNRSYGGLGTGLAVTQGLIQMPGRDNPHRISTRAGNHCHPFNPSNGSVLSPRFTYLA